MAHHHAGVFPPEANHRDAAAVVGIVHAHVVLLVESIGDRQDPVGALLGGLALKRPEARVVTGTGHFQVAEHPAVHRQVARSFVGIFHPHHQRGRELLILCERQLASQPEGGFGVENGAAAGAEGVVHPTGCLRKRGEGNDGSLDGDRSEVRGVREKQCRGERCRQGHAAVFLHLQCDVGGGLAAAAARQQGQGGRQAEGDGYPRLHNPSFWPKCFQAASSTAASEEKAPVPPAAVVLTAPVRLPIRWHSSRLLPQTKAETKPAS